MRKFNTTADHVGGFSVVGIFRVGGSCWVGVDQWLRWGFLGVAGFRVGGFFGVGGFHVGGFFGVGGFHLGGFFWASLFDPHFGAGGFRRWIFFGRETRRKKIHLRNPPTPKSRNPQAPLLRKNRKIHQHPSGPAWEIHRRPLWPKR